MAGQRPSKQGGKATNKAKRNRRTFAPKTAKYKSDFLDAVCTTFVDTDASIQHIGSNTGGALANLAQIGVAGSANNGDAISLSATIPLDARAPIWASHRHASLLQMYNEWNTAGVYIDLLFSKELRENCDQIFILAERGNNVAITDVKQMVSDVNCRMYQLGNNTQKLTYKYVFNTSADKINKKSAEALAGTQPSSTEMVFLKILCTGQNGSATTAIPAGALQIKMRGKFFNKYRDMRVLSSDLN